MMLRAVCFDLMDTVITDPYLAALEAGTGMTVREAVALLDRTAWPDFELGLIDEAEFLRRFWRDGTQNCHLDIEAFHAARRQGYAFIEGMEQLLDDLAGRVERYVASNYPVWVEELTENFGFARRFDGVFASCTLGARKPDVQFYERLLSKIGHQPQECLFVDDRAVNCEAAESVGMVGHVFVGVSDLRDRLAAEGLLVRETQ